MKTGRCLFALLTCLCLAALARPAHAEPSATPVSVFDGLVVGVSEGDRITVNHRGKELMVQLYGVAAPQTVKMDKYTGWYKTGQPYAEDAFRALSTKVLHQVVRVEVRGTLVKKGDANSTLAVAIVSVEGRNVNLEMLSEGWVWVYRKYLDRTDLPAYLSAERQARARKNGLWIQESPVPPWHFQPKLRAATRKPG